MMAIYEYPFQEIFTSEELNILLNFHILWIIKMLSIFITCISLIAGEADHLFLNLLANFIFSLLWNIHFYPLSICFGLLIFSLLICNSSSKIGHITLGLITLNVFFQLTFKPQCFHVFYAHFNFFAGRVSYDLLCICAFFLSEFI